MVSREDTIKMMTNEIDLNLMINVIFEYIFEATGERVSGQINISPFSQMMIHQHFPTALEWFIKKNNINILSNKNKEIIKIF